jgi:glycosyltransferase involved in cell wall biosynthesis
LKTNAIAVIPVQASFFGETKFAKRYQIDRPNIGFVGRIQKERSYKKLIWILEILASGGYTFSLQIIGDGPGIDKLKKTIETRLPKIQVTYSGWLDGDVLAREFSKIDILVSTAEFESYGRSIREAEMMGIPVLAIRSSGVVDAAFDSKTHLIHIIEQDDLSDEILEKYNGVIHQVMNFTHEKPIERIFDGKSLLNSSSELARLWITL